MARRATSLTNKRTAARGKTSADVPEPIAAKTPRRGKGAKLRASPRAGVSVADAFYPGGEEPAAGVADPGSNEPTKGRRGRKPKTQPAADALTMEDDTTRAISSPAKDEQSVARNEAPEMGGDSTATSSEPPRKRRGRKAAVVEQPSPSSMESVSPAAPQSSAVRWDAATGTATFDWPGIEHVAATGGPNQAMAKLLLAARAEGANSRWPF